MTTTTDTHTLSTLQPKSAFIDKLTLGDSLADIFLLSSARQQQAKNGPYWLLEFRDRGGVIGGKIWSPQSQNYPNLAPGLMVHVTGKTTSYRDKMELSVEQLRVLNDEERSCLSLSDFMPSSPYDPDVMLADLHNLVDATIVHTPLQIFMSSLLDDEEIRSGLCQSPAAKSMHHAYPGGLLEHTLSVSRLCLALAGHYPHIDRQILLAGAICHDLGKVWELKADLASGFSIDYTGSGRLLGHISLVWGKLLPFIVNSGLETEFTEHLQHLILSHHGTREFGAPVLPATAEALLLHYADNIDAKMQQVHTALANVSEGASGWSAYVPSLERFLFQAVPTPKVNNAGADNFQTAPFQDNYDLEDNVEGSTEPPVVDVPQAIKVTAPDFRYEVATDLPAPDKRPTPSLASSVEQSSLQPLPLFSQCLLLSKE